MLDVQWPFVFVQTSNQQVVQLVQQMADHLPAKKLQVVFLINNYHEVRKLCAVGHDLPLGLPSFLVTNGVPSTAGATIALLCESVSCVWHLTNLYMISSFHIYHKIGVP